MFHNLERFVIEAKDNYGWFDYETYSDLERAKKAFKELKEGFPEIKLIDKQNMLEITVD